MVRKEIRIDIEKCTGCRHCELFCSLKHSEEGVVNPKVSRIRIYSDFDQEISLPIISGPYTDAKCTSKYNIIMGEKEYESCLLCRAACPIRPFFFEPGTEVPLKCDLCGEPPDPACVKWCVHGALKLVEVEVEESEESA